MSTEHELARALVLAHTDAAVAPVVLNAFDAWALKVASASEALERANREGVALERFYTIPELMVLFKKSDSGVRALLDRGDIAFTRIGGSIRVPIEEAERYLEENTNRKEQRTVRAAGAKRSIEDEEAIRRYPHLAS